MIEPMTHIATTLTSMSVAAASAPDSGSGTPPTIWDERMEQALFIIVDIGIISLGLAFLACLWRIARGPTLVDRGLASDTLAMQVVGFAALISIRSRTLMFYDAVLIVAILGFVSTIAFAQFIGRRRAV